MDLADHFPLVYHRGQDGLVFQILWMPWSAMGLISAEMRPTSFCVCVPIPIVERKSPAEMQAQHDADGVSYRIQVEGRVLQLGG